MKRNKPSNDDCKAINDIVDDGDLSQWEYLTMFYDHDETFDNHAGAGSNSELPLHVDQSTVIPANTSILDSLSCDSTGAMQKHAPRLNGDHESNNFECEPLLHTPSSMLATKSTSNLGEQGTDRAMYTRSSEHQHTQHSSEQQPLLSESMRKRANPDMSSALEQSTPRPLLFLSDLHRGHNMESFESTTSARNVDSCISLAFKNIDHNQTISATNAEIPSAVWYSNCGLQGLTEESEVKLAQWETQNLEPISISMVKDETLHSASEYSETSASIGNIGECDLDKTNVAIGSTIEDRIQNHDYKYSCNLNRNEVNSHVELASQTLPTAHDGNAPQQITSSLVLQGFMAPPHQQLKNNSLLLKPLTPYNYYYRDERDNIVLQISNESDPLPPSVSDFSIEKMQRLLYQHWYVDPVREKRIHRKTHGKMSFQNLSKVISERWRALSSQGREFYRTVARNDEIYYNQQLVYVMKNEGCTGSLQLVVSDGRDKDKSKPEAKLLGQSATSMPEKDITGPAETLSNDKN